jgi:hypothetical protein
VFPKLGRLEDVAMKRRAREVKQGCRLHHDPYSRRRRPTGQVGATTMREVGTGQLDNRVKVVRTGTLEPAHADGPKPDDSCKGRAGVWTNEGVGQEDQGRSVFGPVTKMELCCYLAHLSMSIMLFDGSGAASLRPVFQWFCDFQTDTPNLFFEALQLSRRR